MVCSSAFTGLGLVGHLPPSLTSMSNVSAEGHTGMTNVSTEVPVGNDSLGMWKSWSKSG